VALDLAINFICLPSVHHICLLSCQILSYSSVRSCYYYVVCMFLKFMKVDLEIYGTRTFALTSIISLFMLFIMEFVSFKLLIEMGIGFVQWRLIGV